MTRRCNVAGEHVHHFTGGSVAQANGAVGVAGPDGCTAVGDRESQILRAQADREASILRAQGEGQAIQTVFQAIHDGQPDQSLLAYQYLQMMPKIAEGSANKVWVIPSEITKAMEGLGSSIHEIAGIPRDATPRTRGDMGPSEPQLPSTQRPDAEVSATNKAVQDAIAAAESASKVTRGSAPVEPPPADTAGTTSDTGQEPPPA